ncbi:conserved hypothetical protein [Candida tropicalis MYA-3404]|uniref:Essential protein Yae1 N-terminal domain-containing protein n=1 Tax=Candida tropicalis (strain ATCC MYA-3404 / T1) TaxID=294747 RepID=C5M3R4_CANTT|nr:conserved hypothetical protein [Candida tropicalis MYA-3404]EER35964.1 conserved hypothetical protein [Candida tropicalis MYA-3404]KAG4410082.1 hypothetical protein JTP64_000720 [Candida tropicalis]
MSDFDIDEVLNLEEEQYNLGFKEGQEHSTKEQYLEGKQYGYQTGFQRFLIVGYIQGLVGEWLDNLDNYNASKSLQGHINQLSELITDIPLTNGDEEVEKYEKNIKKARNKLRVIANITKENWRIENLDNLVKEVGGTLQVSENQDDMW